MACALDGDPQHARMPEPLRERPPADRYCDLVLTGGVASGVVYPWAMLELARQFRFRNLGGTSVGALAAALAAACEYGRRHGFDDGFEVLRRLPGELAARPGAGDAHAAADDAARPACARGPASADRQPLGHRTRLLALFEPQPQGRRLFGLLLHALDLAYANPGADGVKPPARRGAAVLWALRGRIADAYAMTGPLSYAALAAFAAVLAGFSWVVLPLPGPGAPCTKCLVGVMLGSGLVAVALLGVAARRLWQGLRQDLSQGLAEQDLGLCKGAALVDWLDEGVQKAAGLSRHAPPLTFEDLWHAPLTPGGPRPAVGHGGVPVERAINLEMVTTNVTHGRPYRLPLADPDARLFFRRQEWEGVVPPRVLKALYEASEPYRRKSGADPEHAIVVDPRDGSQGPADDLRELPGARMPIVVAARLSLSYPLLLSAPPLYAIDHEAPQPQLRLLRRVRISDGGLSSNFPVHFFDSALPRWPTFGIWLERRSPHWPGQAVWLPTFAGQGRGDNWQRFDVGHPPPAQRDDGDAGCGAAQAEPDGPAAPAGLGAGTLLSFLFAAFMATKNWKDHSALRMPHVRRRVVRVGLLPGEGELNIGMPARTLMHMAGTYGTAAGQALCRVYAPGPQGSGPTRAWEEHLWQRLDVLLAGMGDLFRHFGAAAHSAGHTRELRRLIQQAQTRPPLQRRSDRRTLSPEQAQALLQVVDALEALQASLQRLPPLPQSSAPKPELRLRPPL